MKTLFSILTSLVLIVSVSAQTAEEWMNKLSETYTKTPSYYIKFEMKETGNSSTQTGEIFALKEKYSLEVMDIKQMYDGKSLFTISKEDKEITVSTPDMNSEDFLTPTKVTRMYQSGYKLSLGKTATVGGKKIQYIKLVPNQKSDADYMLVGINTSNNSLYQYEEFYKNGGSRTITVKDFIQNLIIPRALFKFDKSKYEKDGYIVTPI
jgi:outer membrane lipoprotein-sorting protein